MPYTERSRANLLREGFAPDRVYVTGNPIKEVIDHYAERIGASRALGELGLEKRRYFLVTMHRAENVDVETRLRSLVEALAELHKQTGHPIICSLHPRTRAKAQMFGVDLNRAGIRFLDPLGFFDFIKLEQNAFCLISDSGTVQEEACLFRVPTVTIRDVTERPETIECGSNVLTGCDPRHILQMVNLVTSRPANWQPPCEYLAAQVAMTVCRIVLGFRLPDLAEQGWNGLPSTPGCNNRTD
jgi:UDP-N-acetylglucosamine 2-epimerase (non-hydrolysing)